jgi:hypothetical protein
VRVMGSLQLWGDKVRLHLLIGSHWCFQQHKRTLCVLFAMLGLLP